MRVCSRHCAEPAAERASAEGKDHDFLAEIAEEGLPDLAIGGAEYLLDDGGVRGACIGLPAFARNREAAGRLMDFLTTPEARSCYLRFGWSPPDTSLP